MPVRSALTWATFPSCWAGLIVAIDGEKIQDQVDLTQMMNNHRAGDTVKVTIYRNKKKLDVEVSLGEARQQV